MSSIAGVQAVAAPYGYSQDEITEAFAAVMSPKGAEREVIDHIHRATGVKHRNLALPIEDYVELAGFGAANDEFIRVGADLGAAAVTSALAAANMGPADVDLIASVTVTGVAAPSLEARLFSRIGLREDTKRIPMFGLGCVAGAAGIARLHDYLVGHPDDVAVLLSVELCSLTLQRDDVSLTNIVGSGLFGDGAAAVVMVGERRAERMGITGPSVVASRSRLYPDTQRTMGWDIGGSGFRIVLAPNVGEIINTHLGEDVGGFLRDHDLTITDIDRWVSHPGGPRVLEAIESALDLNDGQLDASWRSLAAVGNLSSASVLHVLGDTLAGTDTPRPESGTPGMLMAMGPGFCAELVLLRW